MVSFVTLACPSCGKKLKIGEKNDSLVCRYCEVVLFIERLGNETTLVTAALKNKHTQYRIAITRLENEIREIYAQINRITRPQRDYDFGDDFHHLVKERNITIYEKVIIELDKTFQNMKYMVDNKDKVGLSVLSQLMEQGEGDIEERNIDYESRLERFKVLVQTLRDRQKKLEKQYQLLDEADQEQI